MLNEIIRTHYQNVDWKRQLLALAIIRGRGLSQYLARPQDPAALRAHYWSPTTQHRFYSCSFNSLAADRVDTLPCLFADVDYPSRESRPAWGEVYVSLLDEGLPPTLIIETPNRGFHLYWYLKRPLIARYERDENGVWGLRKGAEKGLAWWRDLSFMLHRRLIALGIPADTAGAGSPARLLRFPREENVRYWHSPALYEMQQLTDQLESWRLSRALSLGSGRMVSLEGAPEGERNSHCWKLALPLAAEYKGEEQGLRILLDWAGRCDPPYSQGETLYVWRWAVRKVLAGEGFVYKKRTGERTRKEQGPYAGKMNKLSTDEKIAAAIAEMQANGWKDPFNEWGGMKELSRLSGVTTRTLSQKAKQYRE